MMLEYNMAGGKRLPGLVKRRQAEARLFTQGYEGDDQ
jgi:GH24 family phage-related lysozyme (muramidase)